MEAFEVVGIIVVALVFYAIASYLLWLFISGLLELSFLYEKGDKMTEYYDGIKPIAIRTIRKGDELDMTLPNPITTVKFVAYSVGTYIVKVDANGNWTSRYCFGPTEEEE